MRIMIASTRAAPLIKSLSLQPLAFKPRAPSNTFSVRCNASESNGNTPEFRGFGQPPTDKPKSTADALRQSLGNVSNAEGRVARSTNVVLGDDESEEKWRELDQQVNDPYPRQQTFKAIGSGGDDFIAAMTKCVEDVVGKVHEECVTSRYSAKGKWLSVTIGPVFVQTPEEVLAIYNAMKADGRLKFYI